MAFATFKNEKINVILNHMMLRNLIETSQLQQEDKNLWFSLLESLDDTQIKIFEDFVDGKEENLKELTENLKAKRKAFETADQELLDSILQREQE